MVIQKHTQQLIRKAWRHHWTFLARKPNGDAFWATSCRKIPSISYLWHLAKTSSHNLENFVFFSSKIHTIGQSKRVGVILQIMVQAKVVKITYDVDGWTNVLFLGSPKSDHFGGTGIRPDTSDMETNSTWNILPHKIHFLSENLVRCNCNSNIYLLFFSSSNITLSPHPPLLMTDLMR